jgi:predicted small secreted protein
MTRRISLITLALIGALSLSGCVNTTAGVSEDTMTSEGVEAMPDIAMEEQMASDMAGRDAVAVERSQIITGDVYLTVDAPLEAADQVQAIVESAGGRVDSRSEYTDWQTELPSAYLWVRIPVDALDDTLASIEALGVLESKSLNNSDVTLQVVDLDARIGVLESSIQKLRDLQDQAATTAELIEVETALSERQAELDSLNSQRNYLTDQVQYASIGVQLSSPDVAPEREPGGFLDGIISGWNAMIAFFAGTIVFFGFIVPWVGLLAAVAIVVWIVVAVRRRNSRKDS